MTLLFKGKLIYGTHGPIVRPSPELQLRRGRYWQVKGEYEVMGNVGGRSLMVDLTFHHNFTTIDQLNEALRNLEKQLGQHGTLLETGTVTQKFDNCTFERFEHIAIDGQVAPGPLQDIAGTLYDDDGEGDGGWFVTLMLYFRQLLVPNV